jgi:putative heme iron utilization protein
MTKAQNKAQASDAFIARKAEIDAMLERIKALSDDHFDTCPDDINWGHVGTLAHYADLLKRITDAAFKEGEHAE